MSKPADDERREKSSRRKAKKAATAQEEMQAEEIITQTTEDEEKAIGRPTANQMITTTNVEKYALDEITNSAIIHLEKNRRVQTLANIDSELFSQINMELYSVLSVMYRQAQINKNPDDTKPDIMSVDELREEINGNPEDFFLLCKKFAPTEESSKDLTEAVKRVKLVLLLGNPASAITWLHKCLRAIVAQGAEDSFTQDQAQELSYDL